MFRNKASNPVNVMAYASNHSRWEAEAGGLPQVRSQPELHGVSGARLCDVVLVGCSTWSWTLPVSAQIRSPILEMKM